jgi:hypothetical protein
MPAAPPVNKNPQLPSLESGGKPPKPPGWGTGDPDPRHVHVLPGIVRELLVSALARRRRLPRTTTTCSLSPPKIQFAKMSPKNPADRKKKTPNRGPRPTPEGLRPQHPQENNGGHSAAAHVASMLCRVRQLDRDMHNPRRAAYVFYRRMHGIPYVDRFACADT